MQLGILCELEERKLTFNVTTDSNTDKDTLTIVKRMYLPISGTFMEVEGMSSIISSWNMDSESKIVIQREIFSPLSEGR